MFDPEVFETQVYLDETMERNRKIRYIVDTLVNTFIYNPCEYIYQWSLHKYLLIKILLGF